MKIVKTLWSIIFVLILVQAFSLLYFFSEKDDVMPEQAAEVVAEVSDHQITINDLMDRLLREYGENILDDMINRTLIFSEADKLGMTIAEEEIEREIMHIRKDYATEEEFYQSLEEQVGVSVEELREEIRYYLLLEEMATKDIVITEEQIRAYYEENMDLFYFPTRFHLHQIIVPSEEEAYQVIDEIEQGSSFEAVAAERSTDLITAADGGDMGFVSSQDFFVPYEIILIAEELELEQLSEPIALEEGFAVIKVTQRVEGGQQNYEEVKDKIRRELALQEIDGIQNYLDRLRQNANIQNRLHEYLNS